ncbi:protein of unknown function [Xenorhabdus doucetiae]|uniref:Uncharacterized protein n=1 Tax=Xenorhabdus doucetiae TaxID=351671 RepID=A0A068QXV1_9GAMM|nr:protein of unknown function [Xenorhabdus doucetiae]
MSYLQEPQLIYFVHYGVALNMRIQDNNHKSDNLFSLAKRNLFCIW